MEFKHAHTEEAAIKCSEWPAPTLRPIHTHTHTHVLWVFGCLCVNFMARSRLRVNTQCVGNS